jgi:trans-2,3-dihydro-3-hydroxyanthranilate isomerase
MTDKHFIIADVFTTKRFGGNQLAVFTDGSNLDTATMQAIALEMNYSETTFLLAPEKGGDYRVRIFTPINELPFAGHPIVGTGFVIVAEKLIPQTEPATTVKLETAVGEIIVTVETQNGLPAHTVMTQPLPLVRSVWADVDRLANALSLKVTDLESTGLPVEVLFNGIPVMIVPVASLAAVEQIKVDTRALEAISREAGAITVLTFTKETLRPSSTAHCRVFVPLQGIPEDAATGSANGPLGFYFVRHNLVVPQPTTTVISEQGFEMGRPSIITIELELDEAEHEVRGVRVGGGVVITGHGEMILS